MRDDHYDLMGFSSEKEKEEYKKKVQQDLDRYGMFFIGTDCSGHEYIVPFAKYDEWNEWVDIPEDDERSWEEPSYAIRLDGGTLIFQKPQIYTGKKLKDIST